MKSWVNKIPIILLSFFLTSILLTNTIQANNKIPDKILSSTVFLFKKDNNKNEIPIGTGVIVQNGNILINYSSIAPYEAIIPNSNNRYSRLISTNLNEVIVKTYSNMQIDSTTINKVIAFDKNLNLILLEPKNKIGKPVTFSNNNTKNNSLNCYVMPYKQTQIDWLGVSKNNIKRYNEKEVNTTYSVNLNTDIVNTNTSIPISYFFITFSYNEKSELVTLYKGYPEKRIEDLRYKDFLQLAEQCYDNYKLLLGKKNGDQFTQFYIAEQFNTIYNRTTQILYIDNICKGLKFELYNVKKINYFNNIEEYDKLKENIDLFINSFGSSTLYESIAEDLYSLGLKDDAIYCMFLSSLEKGSINKIKYCKWLIEDNQIALALSVLQNSYNYYNDWRVLSEIDILISYCELLSGNLKEAELYKNKSIEHGISFYNSYGQDITDKYKYIIDKLDVK
ncbi:MAG: hypothetical protein U0U67_13820 [Chitinophagales bacterium]